MSARGANPADAALFGDQALPALRSAAADLSWLLGRGYNYVAAVALVGNKRQLTLRQRTGCSINRSVTVGVSRG
ncbi:MAG: hypothetical protein ACI9MC_001078 [Kiritimatiellia bacterium]